MKEGPSEGPPEGIMTEGPAEGRSVGTLEGIMKDGPSEGRSVGTLEGIMKDGPSEGRSVGTSEGIMMEGPSEGLRVGTLEGIMKEGLFVGTMLGKSLRVGTDEGMELTVGAVVGSKEGVVRVGEKLREGNELGVSEAREGSPLGTDDGLARVGRDDGLAVVPEVGIEEGNIVGSNDGISEDCDGVVLGIIDGPRDRLGTELGKLLVLGGSDGLNDGIVPVGDELTDGLFVGLTEGILEGDPLGMTSVGTNEGPFDGASVKAALSDGETEGSADSAGTETEDGPPTITWLGELDGSTVSSEGPSTRTEGEVLGSPVSSSTRTEGEALGSPVSSSTRIEGAALGSPVSSSTRIEGEALGSPASSSTRIEGAALGSPASSSTRIEGAALGSPASSSTRIEGAALGSPASSSTRIEGAALGSPASSSTRIEGAALGSSVSLVGGALLIVTLGANEGTAVSSGGEPDGTLDGSSVWTGTGGSLLMGAGVPSSEGAALGSTVSETGGAFFMTELGAMEGVPVSLGGLDRSPGGELGVSSPFGAAEGLAVVSKTTFVTTTLVGRKSPKKIWRLARSDRTLRYKVRAPDVSAS